MRGACVALAFVVVAGCSRNRTPAAPGLEVKTGGTKVSGAVMIGQPLTLVAEWSGTCERYSSGNSKEPFKGEWSKGTCNQVTSFDIDVKCSLACTVGKQWSDVNFTVFREVIPQQAGNLELDITYKATLRDDRHVAYAVTVHAPKSVALAGCGNQKLIPLDALVLAPPGQSAPAQPIYCKKADEEAEGSIRVIATTTDDRKLNMPIGVTGSDSSTVMALPMSQLEQLFGPAFEPGVYPVRIDVMGKPIDLQIDLRERIRP